MHHADLQPIEGLYISFCCCAFVSHVKILDEAYALRPAKCQTLSNNWLVMCRRPELEG